MCIRDRLEFFSVIGETGLKLGDATKAVFARISVPDDKCGQFEQAAQPLLGQVHQNEPGCFLFALGKSKDEAGSYRFVELYQNGAAIKAHVATNYFGAAQQTQAPLIESSEVTVLEVVGNSGARPQIRPRL
eukprot:TRINITY_DN39329_c0_g1_i1.p1 TRINITY_DN39329_c0_g1~~TRINITY_DN39329_c0_g1_i1.p1  ORF type:complete len:140 (-),score=32.54 TRINITY_DN39329_c0_g1_i1:98-490(-)